MSIAGAVNPTRQAARVTGIEIMATGQHRDARPRRSRTIEHAIGERAARMTRDDDIV